MMKKIYYILFLLLAGFCFNSCVSEEEDLFDKSAAERMNEALTKYKAILQDDPQGWVMEFYPSDRSMGGYTYTAKFDNGKVDMTSELSLNSSSGDKWPAGTVVTSYTGLSPNKVHFLHSILTICCSISFQNQEGPVMLTDMPATMSLCLWK